MTAIDLEGDAFEQAVRDSKSLTEAEASLVMSGRREMADAWHSFMSQRDLVPGKLIALIAASAQGVVDGAMIIATGDDRMALDWQAQRTDLFGLTPGVW
ncbi:hypothetical protein AB3M82_05345 [Microbacterium sp. 179-I 3D4 NHS]